jgi:hypothetical protein
VFLSFFLLSLWFCCVIWFFLLNLIYLFVS